MKISELFPLIHKYNVPGEYREQCYDVIRTILKHRRALDIENDVLELVNPDVYMAVRKLFERVYDRVDDNMDALEDILDYPEVLAERDEEDMDDEDTIVTTTYSVFRDSVMTALLAVNVCLSGFLVYKQMLTPQDV